MKKLVLFAALTALSACSQKADKPKDTEPAVAAATAVPASAVGVFDVKMTDGTMATTVIDTNGTYVDTGSDGQTVKGRFAVKDSKDCFDPEGDKPEVCWTVTTPGADGSFTATAPDGTSVTVSPKKPAEAAQ